MRIQDFTMRICKIQPLNIFNKINASEGRCRGTALIEIII